MTAGAAFRPVDRHGHIGPTRLSGQGVALVLKRHAARAGLQGVPMEVVSKWLGHFSIWITADTYAHLLPGQRGQAATSMDNMLAQARAAREASKWTR